MSLVFRDPLDLLVPLDSLVVLELRYVHLSYLDKLAVDRWLSRKMPPH